MRWNSSRSTSLAARPDVRLNFLRGRGIRLLGRQIDEFAGITQAALEAIQAADHLLELRALPAQLLCAFRRVPNPRLLEFARYFLQTFVLVVVIKDTSSRNRCVPRDL